MTTRYMHGNGNSHSHEIPMVFPWEWEFGLLMGMGIAYFICTKNKISIVVYRQCEQPAVFAR